MWEWGAKCHYRTINLPIIKLQFATKFYTMSQNIANIAKIVCAVDGVARLIYSLKRICMPTRLVIRPKALPSPLWHFFHSFIIILLPQSKRCSWYSMSSVKFHYLIRQTENPSTNSRMGFFFGRQTSQFEGWGAGNLYFIFLCKIFMRCLSDSCWIWLKFQSFQHFLWKNFVGLVVLSCNHAGKTCLSGKSGGKASFGERNRRKSWKVTLMVL